MSMQSGEAAVLKKGPIRWARVLTWAVMSLAGAGGVVAVLFVYLNRGAQGADPVTKHPPIERPQLSRPDEHSLFVPEDVFPSLGLHTAQASRPTRPRSLPPLNGNLALDTNKLVRIRTPLPGKLMSVGLNEEPAPTGVIQDGVSTRALRQGDRVRGPSGDKPGQLLAVLWSKDLLEKKYELVDALSKLKLDRDRLERYKELDRQGNIPAAKIRDAEREVEIDQINIARVERNLRGWDVSEADIKAVKAEAERLDRKDALKAGEQAQWSKIEIRAPQDGVILEKNYTPGDNVDTSADLFKIGDLSRLIVWVHVYEEDLPALLKMKRPIPWTIRLPAQPEAAFEGHLEQISAVLDPSQHTALASGQVDNSKGELRVGQFVTATINLPQADDDIEVPSGAVVEDGRKSVVFVQPDPSKPRFERREVEVARRFHDVIYLRGRAVKEKDRVVTAGAVLLNDALDNLPVKP